MKKIFLMLSMLILVACTSNKVTDHTQEKVKIVLDYTPNTNHTGIYVALEKGYFSEQGLEVEVVQPPENGAELSVASGYAEFGISFQDMFATSLTNNLPITAIATILAHNTSGLLSLESSHITSFKYLENKNYLTMDLPIEQAMIKQLVTEDKGNFSKVNFVLNQSVDTYSALKTNIDAVWAYDAWDKAYIEMQQEKVNFLLLRELNKTFDYYTPIIIANNDMIQNKKELVQKFINALTKGYEFAINNSQESANILLKYAPELNKALVYKSQEIISNQYVDGTKWGYIDPSRWNQFYQWLNENHLVDRQLKENEGFTNEFIAN